MFYNYLYLDPRKKGHYIYENLELCFLYEPFYVGKGTKNRSEVHLKEWSINNDTNKIKTNKIKNIKKEYNSPYIVKFNYTKNENDVLLNEKHLISEIGKILDNSGPLTNITSGGEGVSGLKHSEKTKSKMSISHTGFKHSEETKKKMSINMIGNNYATGKKHSKETKEKMSESCKNRIYKPLTEEHKKRISKGTKGIKPSKEATEKNRKNNQNKVNVIDPKNPDIGIFRVSIYDERYKKGELINAMKGYKHKIKKCPYCGKEGSGGNMTRYHFDNCKYKNMAL